MQTKRRLNPEYDNFKPMRQPRSGRDGRELPKARETCGHATGNTTKSRRKRNKRLRTQSAKFETKVAAAQQSPSRADQSHTRSERAAITTKRTRRQLQTFQDEGLKHVTGNTVEIVKNKIQKGRQNAEN